MATPTQKDVDRVVAGYENAKGAIEYARTIIAEMEQITGSEDYDMVWTTEYSAGN